VRSLRCDSKAYNLWRVNFQDGLQLVDKQRLAGIVAAWKRDAWAMQGSVSAFFAATAAAAAAAVATEARRGRCEQRHSSTHLAGCCSCQRPARPPFLSRYLPVRRALSTRRAAGRAITRRTTISRSVRPQSDDSASDRTAPTDSRGRWVGLCLSLWRSSQPATRSAVTSITLVWIRENGWQRPPPFLLPLQLAEGNFLHHRPQPSYRH